VPTVGTRACIWASDRSVGVDTVCVIDADMLVYFISKEKEKRARVITCACRHAKLSELVPRLCRFDS
jgi:hypothetical protein